MLVLAGKGHVSGRSGIPNRVTRHTGERGVTIATFDPHSRLFNKADYIVLANEQTLPPAGIMRVMLDENDDGVVIKDFAGKSPALTAGAKRGDVIVAINGEPVASFLDLKLLMMDQAPGNEVELTVSRDRFFGGKQTESVKFALVAGRS
jgi:C-terminal processing protease CtpA/Prc